MKYLVIISTLFVIGSIFGWCLELLFRRFVSQKKWMNPGFLTGPYLPIYGSGVVVLYGISNVPLGITNHAADIIVRILIIGVGMTVIEFIAGLIFIKGMGIKLWDYSDRKGNIMGIICPIFSSENLIYTYFVGIVIGMIVVDFAYSLHLGLKIKELKEASSIRYEELKNIVRKKMKELRETK